MHPESLSLTYGSVLKEVDDMDLLSVTFHLKIIFEKHPAVYKRASLPIGDL